MIDTYAIHILLQNVEPQKIPTHTHIHTYNCTRIQIHQTTKIFTQKNDTSFPTGLVHWHHAARTNQKVVEYLDHYYGDTQALVLQIIVPECTQQHTAPYRHCLMKLTKWNRSSARSIKSNAQKQIRSVQTETHARPLNIKRKKNHIELGKNYISFILSTENLHIHIK